MSKFIGVYHDGKLHRLHMDAGELCNTDDVTDRRYFSPRAALRMLLEMDAGDRYSDAYFCEHCLPLDTPPSSAR